MGEAIINDGTFNNTATITTTGTNTPLIANILNQYNENLGTVPSMTINGGTFNSLKYYIYNSVANIVITSANCNSAYYVIYAPKNSTTGDSDVVVDVSGSVFVGNGTNGTALYVESGYRCSITGGSFTGASRGLYIATATEATISNTAITTTTGK